MKNKEKKNKRENKNESEIVTKESFSSAFMLFSLIALFMLCTGASVFGAVGAAIRAFLIGTFGYFAYPVCVGASYLFLMMLLGKRLVKNRWAGVMLALSLVFAGLIAHCALTFSWELEGYVEKCFAAGETFPNSTACGLLGGLAIYGLSSLMSKTGAIVLLSVFFLISTYLFIILSRKNKKEKVSKKDKNSKSKKAATEQNDTQNGTQGQRQAQNNGTSNPATNNNVAPNNGYSNGYTQANATYPQNNQQTRQDPYGGDMRYTQRPGVRLTEGATSEERGSNTYGFSPFGGSNQPSREDKSLERSYQDAREFLFGQGATESYKQNLIFDPNANVNNLPPIEPMAGQPITNSSYVPSYTEQYQDDMNSSQSEVRPPKVVTDNTYGATPRQEDNWYHQNTRQDGYQDGYQGGYQNTENNRPVQQEQPISYEEPDDAPDYTYDTEAQSQYSSIEPLKPIEDFTPQREEPYVEPVREEYLHIEPEVVTPSPFETSAAPQEETNRETPREPETTGYRRHNYIDIFAVDNPQDLNHEDVFGRRDEIPEPSRYERVEENVDEPTTRSDRGSVSFETPSVLEEEQDSRGRGERRDIGALFDDDEEDNPYELRSDCEVDTTRGFTETPSRGESTEDVEITDRGRMFEESPADLPPSIEPTPVQDTPPSPVTPPKSTTPPKPIMPPKPRIPKPYVRMSLDDLDCRDVEPLQNHEEVESAKTTIIAILEEFKISGATISSVTFGPTVTRYNVTLPRGIVPSKVVALEELISMNLYSEGVNIYPNFKDGVVSIEVPNKERQFVQLGSMLSGDSYVNAKPSSLMFAMGKDVANKKVYGDISKMIHMLVAGASGSGKSVFLGALIISLIHKYSPEELRLILIDPKKTEFVLYNGLPHLMINEIITEANKAVQSLNWAIDEMNRRYSLFQEMSNAGTYVVNLDQYNEKLEKTQRLPKIVIIIDELADLMLEAKKDMEEKIQNLTQKARAAGIHLIVATQRPSTDIITGVIKSNLPTRIAFGVASDVDSRVILDQSGADKLLGKGDLLYTMQGINTPVRVQSAFISPEDSQKIVNFIKEHNEAYYDEAATAYINNARGGSGDSSKASNNNVEPIYIDALKFVILSGSASISMIQRKCSAGYNKAGKIIEWMEEMGYISPFDGAKARKVLISKEEFESKYGPM